MSLNSNDFYNALVAVVEQLTIVNERLNTIEIGLSNIQNASCNNIQEVPEDDLMSTLNDFKIGKAPKEIPVPKTTYTGMKISTPHSCDVVQFK